MITSNLQEFFPNLKQGHTILSIDYGSKKIGVALSTPNHKIVLPHQTIVQITPKKQLQALNELLRRHKSCALIIGLPLNMDGTKGQQATEIVKFAEKLFTQSHVPIFLQDERLTSIAADQLLQSFNLGLSRKARSTQDDSIAAIMILERFLESVNNFQKS